MIQQNVSVGTDLGLKHVGISAMTKSKENFACQVELRTDVTKKFQPEELFIIKMIPRHNRSLHLMKPSKGGVRSTIADMTLYNMEKTKHS